MCTTPMLIEITRMLLNDILKTFENPFVKKDLKYARDESCPHGYLTPVHVHIHTKTIKADSTIIIKRETLVNCALCQR